jgi:hypothetical protein
MIFLPTQSNTDTVTDTGTGIENTSRCLAFTEKNEGWKPIIDSNLSIYLLIPWTIQWFESGE